MSRTKSSTNSAAIQAFIPELRIAARKLVDGSPTLPDDLVQQALPARAREEVGHHRHHS